MSTTNEAVVGNLQQLLSKLEANKADLPQLEISMTKLGTVMARVMDVSKQQAALTASKQAASKELQTLLTEGQRLANGIRALLKEHYGIRSEKLAEFGLQPFRGRVRTVKPPTPAPATPPATPTSAPHSTPTASG
jgi:chromosome segregation ATPase